MKIFALRDVGLTMKKVPAVKVLVVSIRKHSIRTSASREGGKIMDSWRDVWSVGGGRYALDIGNVEYRYICRISSH